MILYETNHRIINLNVCCPTELFSEIEDGPLSRKRYRRPCFLKKENVLNFKTQLSDKIENNFMQRH